MNWPMVFVCLVMTSLFGYTQCNKVKTLERQLVKLIGRQALDKDEFNERLKSVEKALNDSTDQPKCCETNIQSSDSVSTYQDTNESFVKKEDFFSLAKAFKEEKTASGRMRRHVTSKVTSLNKQVGNVLHDVASIRINMCTATELQIINNITETMKSETENISQAVQSTKADVTVAINKIDRVEEALDTIVGNVSSELASLSNKVSTSTELQIINNITETLKSETENISQVVQITKADVTVAINKIDEVEEALNKHLGNVSHDLASIRINMCTASELQIINNITETVKSETENISQVVQITKADITVAINKIDRVEKALDKHLGNVSHDLASIRINICTATELQIINNITETVKSETENISQVVQITKADVTVAINKIDRVEKALDKHLGNVSHDLASIRFNMCTATELQIINNITETVKSETESISQAVQSTKADVTVAINKIDKVEEALDKVLVNVSSESLSNKVSTSTELHTISTAIVSMKSEVENISQEVHNTKESLDTQVSDMSETVALIKSIWNVTQSMKDEFDHFGKSIKSLSERIGKLENSRATKAPDDRLETVGSTVSTLSPQILSCLAHYKAGSRRDGVYTVYIKDYDKSIDVYCDMTTDGGGWTVFQRRKDGSVDFFRDWQNYKQGFGDLRGEFWLGNDNIAALTNPCCHELRIDLMNFDNKTTYAKYGKFNILPENENYKLYVDNYSGNAGNSFLKSHNNMLFSTKDRDNDIWYGGCANSFKGGWWYKECYTSNLNGVYDKTLGNNSGERLRSRNGPHYAYPAMTEMKLR